MSNGVVFPRSSALTQRSLLRLSAAAAGAAALAPVTRLERLCQEAEAAQGTRAAYRRHRRRRRCRSDRGLSLCTPPARRRFCSRRAIVGVGACSPNTISTRACSASSAASSSTPITRICRSSPRKLGVEMQKLTADGGDDLYFFKGVFHTPKDMIDPAKKTRRLCADRQADRQGRRQAHRQGRQLDGACAQAR